MPFPTVGDVHINRPLTTVSLGYVQQQADFVAGNVFPQVPSVEKSNLYYVYNRGDFFRNNMQKRAPGTPAAAGGYKLANQTFVCDVWAEKKIIDDQIRANSDVPLQPDRDATIWLTQQALINREVNWATAYFGTGIWGTDFTGVSGTPSGNQFKQWDQSSSSPIEDVLAGQLQIKSQTGYFPNTLVLGVQVFFKLLTNPEITDRLKYGQTAPGPVVVSANDLAQLFKVRRVLVMGGIQTSSAENTTDAAGVNDTFAFIGGKNALLAYAADAPGILQPSAGYTFNWTGLTGANAAGMRIKKYRWEIDSADHFDIDNAYAFGLVSKPMGYFFSGAVG